MKSEQSGAGFVGGFLLGGLVGAGLALILTPRSGEESRDALLDGGIELKEKAGEAMVKVQGEADDLLSRARARVQEAMEVGKEAAAQKRAELMSRYQVAKREGEVPYPEETPSEQTPPAE